MFAATLLLMIVVLYARRAPGAILISIVAGTVGAVVIQENASVKQGGWGVVTPDMPPSCSPSPTSGCSTAHAAGRIEESVPADQADRIRWRAIAQATQ